MVKYCLVLLSVIFFSASVICLAQQEDEKENKYQVQMRKIGDEFNKLVHEVEKAGLKVPEKLDKAIDLFKGEINKTTVQEATRIPPEKQFALKMLLERARKVRRGLQSVSRRLKRFNSEKRDGIPPEIKKEITNQMQKYLNAVAETADALSKKEDQRAVEGMGEIRIADALGEHLMETGEITGFLKRAAEMWGEHLNNPQIAGIVKNLKEEYSEWMKQREEFIKTRIQLIHLDVQREIIHLKERSLEMKLEELEQEQEGNWESLEQQIEQLEEAVDRIEEENEDEDDEEDEDGEKKDQNIF